MLGHSHLLLQGLTLPWWHSLCSPQPSHTAAAPGFGEKNILPLVRGWENVSLAPWVFSRGMCCPLPAPPAPGQTQQPQEQSWGRVWGHMWLLFQESFPGKALQEPPLPHCTTAESMSALCSGCSIPGAVQGVWSKMSFKVTPWSCEGTVAPGRVSWGSQEPKGPVW